ncbi:MAG: Spy/CpxP family protein refolding chaperone [Candidatus Latescibacterota bacterium]|nr:Spy/CpxP family protein refolding chaperone [Candidatus Latescibacterota bacterium]
MKTKWTYLVVAALCIATVAAVDAQRGAFGKVRSAAIANKLGLSDEQKTQMEALHQAHRDAIKSLRASGERPSREQMKELFSAHREQMEQILTPEQFEQIKGWKSDNRMGRKERYRGGASSMQPGQDRRGALGQKLGLSEDQRSRAEAIHSDFVARMKELHTAHKADRQALLSQDQLDALAARQGEKGRRRGKVDLDLSQEQRDALKSLSVSFREAHSALREEHKAAFTALLTDEQMASLEALRSTRSERGPRRSRSGSDLGGSADAGSVMSESSLLWSNGNTLPTAVESTSWGRIKRDIAE